MKKQISATMATALAMAHQHGRIVRYVGGYWAPDKAPRDHRGNPVDNVGTSTIESLVLRGRLIYSEWKEGRNGRFPIAAILNPDAGE